MGVQEAASLLRVSLREVMDMCRRDELHAVRFPDGSTAIRRMEVIAKLGAMPAPEAAPEPVVAPARVTIQDVLQQIQQVRREVSDLKKKAV